MHVRWVRLKCKNEGGKNDRKRGGEKKKGCGRVKRGSYSKEKKEQMIETYREEGTIKEKKNRKEETEKAGLNNQLHTAPGEEGSSSFSQGRGRSQGTGGKGHPPPFLVIKRKADRIVGKGRSTGKKRKTFPVIEKREQCSASCRRRVKKKRKKNYRTKGGTTRSTLEKEVAPKGGGSRWNDGKAHGARKKKGEGHSGKVI